MSNPTKTDGNSGNCWRCNNTIYCNRIEYDGQPKLQWQNHNGKSHCDKDGNCKEIPEEETIEAQQTQLSNEQNLNKGESKPEVVSLYTLDEKLDKLKEIETSILHLVTDIKTKGVKIQNE